MVNRILIVTFLVLLGIWGTGEAALVDRGAGLIYCDALDVTFLDHPILSRWEEPLGTTLALDYVATLEYFDPIRNIVWQDWRLPVGISVDGWPKRESEISYLYYGVIYKDSPFPNYGPFENLVDYRYWVDDTHMDPGVGYWVFDFHTGEHHSQYRRDLSYVLPVMDGDVGPAPVPIPGAVWLFSSGLIGLVGLRKRLVE